MGSSLESLRKKPTIFLAAEFKQSVGDGNSNEKFTIGLVERRAFESITDNYKTYLGEL